jgi:broad specificity phosphatase PhoE
MHVADATRVLLVRHGHAAPVDRWLAGRRAGISLSAQGREEAAALAGALRASALRPIAVYASPIERAWETAWTIAAATNLSVVTRQALTELEYGAWTGKTLHELNGLPEWRTYNEHRDRHRPPGGESLAEAQARMVAELERLRSLHAGSTIVVVSHADPIRAVLAHYTGTPLNDALRFTVRTASMTTLELAPTGAAVLGVDVTAAELEGSEPPAPAGPA